MTRIKASARSDSTHRRTSTRVAISIAVIIGMVAAVMQLAVPAAMAAGPPYSGPTTEATGPAYFGPAPNVFPYCDNPTYFDPFPENVNPIGRIDPTGSPNASVTTNGVTMDFTLTAEGAPGTQYPGFFPANGDGDGGDQPKGLEMASGDAATITLSEPLFYTQWVFTDVDRQNEGFFVTPQWTDPADPGQVAVFGGNDQFTFDGTTVNEAVFNDIDQTGHASEDINGRVQVDLLGAVNGIDIRRDIGGGQSGFAIGGGCEPIGVAKEVTSEPTWNGTSFDVTYTIRVRNNLPSADTISADIDAAIAASAIGTTTGQPVGIDLLEVTLEDLLVDPAFSEIIVVSNTNTSGAVAVNPDFDGDADVNLLADGEVIAPESEEEFVLTLQYVPVTDGPVDVFTCVQPYELLNQAVAGGTASGVPVTDASDEGADPDPGVNNGGGETDDPTVVLFPCPPAPEASLDIVKTVVAGPTGTCPAFAEGTVGDPAPLDVTVGNTVTYCISVQNPSTVAVDDVVIIDDQAPDDFDGAIGTLAPGEEATRSFDLVVAGDTPTVNTASVTGVGPDGEPLPQVEDPASIAPQDPPAVPAIELSKTVITGDEACADAVEGNDEFVAGTVGDPIIWCFAVTNTGEVDLTNVTFNDAPAGIADRDLLFGVEPPVLAAGETITFEVASTITAGGFDNVADVSGVASTPNGEPIPDIPAVEDTNDAAFGDVSMTLEKQVLAGSQADCGTAEEQVTVNAGETVTYCFTVTNTGSVALEVTDVVDDTLDVVIPIPAGEQILASGVSVTVSLVTTATSDLVNVATVTGVPVDEDGEPIPDAPTPMPEDPAEVIALEADISVVKTITRQNMPLRGNGVIVYSIEVANAGPDAAQNVVINDQLATGMFLETVPDNPDWDCTRVSRLQLLCTKLTEMAPGETSTLTYRVRPYDAPIGVDLVNTATVTSDTPDPDETNNEDTETTIRVPDLPPIQPPTPTLDYPVFDPPDEVLPSTEDPVPAAPPLALTGVHSALFASAGVLFAMLGGVLLVGARRVDDDRSYGER